MLAVLDDQKMPISDHRVVEHATPRTSSADSATVSRLPSVQGEVPENGCRAVSLRRPPEANLAERLLVVAGGQLDLNLPRLGVLGLRHGQHQQPIAVHGVHP